ncbi:hypothetical protein [Aminipila terrae]|uniref:Uncharacterized protein n=1 Tax=Aminipila terrae TaxID=2697030 RepID=A0A6P1MIN1_9FIRM|nr:hypothetical protein [Aminipila terrae]QHI71456.1 hypothetical protein Ami3637_02845 [Aminipila terrae]
MATNTKNYNLVKPAENELADINVLNKNMDVIDEQILPVNSLFSDDSKKALAAAQGKILNGKIGDLTTLTTEHKETLVQAINEAADGAGITVVTENQYKDMQKAGTVDANKLYGIVDSYDSSAGNVAISETLSAKLGLTAEKNVEKAIDAVDTKASQNAKSIAGIESSLLKKDGSVQMTGVLKTPGIPVGKTESEQIEFDGATICRTIDGVRIVVNAYLDTDGSWKRKKNGAASVVNISALELGYFVGDNGLANSVITWVPHSPLPITGGTLIGGLSVKDIITTQITQFFNANRQALFRNYLSEIDYGYMLINPTSTALHDLIRVGRYSVGEYKIYGEHNITVSTAAPSSALAEGCQHQVYA